MSKDSSAKYYQKDKGRLCKKARERYQSLSKEEIEKSDNMVVNDTRHKNLPKDQKLMLNEYRKKYYKMRKNASL